MPTIYQERFVAQLIMCKTLLQIVKKVTDEPRLYGSKEAGILLRTYLLPKQIHEIKSVILPGIDRISKLIGIAVHPDHYNLGIISNQASCISDILSDMVNVHNTELPLDGRTRVFLSYDSIYAHGVTLIKHIDGNIKPENFIGSPIDWSGLAKKILIEGLTFEQKRLLFVDGYG